SGASAGRPSGPSGAPSVHAEPAVARCDWSGLWGRTSQELRQTTHEGADVARFHHSEQLVVSEIAPMTVIGIQSSTQVNRLSGGGKVPHDSGEVAPFGFDSALNQFVNHFAPRAERSEPLVLPFDRVTRVENPNLECPES